MNINIPDDNIIVEMLPDFLSSWEKDFNDSYLKILKDCDEKELYRFGHTLKGSARQFGIFVLAEFGTHIQKASENKDWEYALSLQTKALETLSEVKQYLYSCGLIATPISANHADTPSNI